MSEDDIKIYLPKYLSSESQDELFQGIKDYPFNFDSRIYTNYLNSENIIFQGDGIGEMLVMNLPDAKAKLAPSMIISNTCDIASANRRLFSSQVVYAPIFNLNKYEKSLKANSNNTEEQINSHIKAIKKNEITQIFFLPKFGNLIDDSLVFLDRLNNFPSSKLKSSDLSKKRLFTLSDFGSYIFLIKLSIHFTRIQDQVERRSVRI